MADEEEYTAIKTVAATVKCEESHLYFTRYFFKARHSIKFRVNWHHEYICDEVEKVFNGETENLVINVSPGASKTELVVINIIARGLALNPRSRFLHLSGSDSLASLNSSAAREIITSDEYQRLWPLKISDDASAKKRWNVEVDGQLAGGVYATSLGGQVTGFRAGHMAEGFQGAIIIDDPMKPEDAYSKTKVNNGNRKLLSTVKSRKANPKTPVILVMQRLGEDDPTAFVMSGAFGGKWKHICIPAVLDEKYIASLPEKYRKLIDMSEPDDKGRVSYWPYKEPIKDLLELEVGQGTDQTGQVISRFVFSSQYQQAPRALGGNIIKGEYFRKYRVLPKLSYRIVFADTAQKTKQRNDYSVFEEWGICADHRIYLIDMVRGKWEGPELKSRGRAFWAKCKARDSKTFGTLREMDVEDKASGTDLIQTFKLPPDNIPVKPIERHLDKLVRVMDGLPYIEAGLVCIPENAPFTSDFVDECEAFAADDSHKHDDQIDPMLDAIAKLLSTRNKMKIWEQLGKEGKASESEH